MKSFPDRAGFLILLGIVATSCSQGGASIVTGLGGDYVRMTTNHDLADVLGWFLRGRMARGT